MLKFRKSEPANFYLVNELLVPTPVLKTNQLLTSKFCKEDDIKEIIFIEAIKKETVK